MLMRSVWNGVVVAAIFLVYQGVRGHLDVEAGVFGVVFGVVLVVVDYLRNRRRNRRRVPASSNDG